MTSTKIMTKAGNHLRNLRDALRRNGTGNPGTSGTEHRLPPASSASEEFSRLNFGRNNGEYHNNGMVSDQHYDLRVATIQVLSQQLKHGKVTVIVNIKLLNQITRQKLDKQKVKNCIFSIIFPLLRAKTQFYSNTSCHSRQFERPKSCRSQPQR